MTKLPPLSISRIGIGAYRLAAGIPEHERALYKALERQPTEATNFNLIDTSHNYGHGKSERLVGQVLAHPRPTTLHRDEVILATKFGYLLPDTVQHLEHMKVPQEEIVRYSRDGFHCIHPEAMKYQLSLSLERLQTKYVDILFVHNPEYYLAANVQDSESNVKKHQKVLLDRLSFVFEALEREIDNGRIRAYGISSNSFSLKPSNPQFLPYQDLLQMATQAFERVRQKKKEPEQSIESPRSQPPPAPRSDHASSKPRTTHHAKVQSEPIAPSPRSSHGLGYLQMPGNLLEMEGVLTTAKWAKSHGLRVFVNRPLNAMSQEHGLVRLASYPAPQSPTFQQAKAKALESIAVLCKRREYLHAKEKRLRSMLDSLDATLQKGLSIIEMEGQAYIRNQLLEELASPVKATPPPASSATSPPPKHTKPSAQELDVLVHDLEQVIRTFDQQVRAQETVRVEQMLKDRGIDLAGEPVEKFALEYLLEHGQVDAVLLGMKREPYVDSARAILKEFLGEPAARS